VVEDEEAQGGEHVFIVYFLLWVAINCDVTSFYPKAKEEIGVFGSADLSL
jgi:hypothetical protein